jgi:propanol-preferring alcohol dehydrogenase
MMQAFRLFGTQDVRLVEVDTPRPGSGEVLIKVAAAGMCGSDVHAVEAADRFGYPLPHTLGHEIVGWVEALGPAVSGWAVGDAVAVFPLVSCERCPNCLDGRANLCRTRFPSSLGAGRDGGMANYVVAPASGLVAIGDLDPVAAAPLTDAGMTSYNVVANVRDRLVEGSRCVVIGIGGLGHVAVQIIRAITPARVIAVDTDAARLSYARQLGAWETVEAGADAKARIAALCEGIGAEVAIDMVGSRETVDLACGVVATGGKLALVGIADGAVEVRLGGALPPQVEVFVPLAGSRHDLEAVIALARAGKVAAKTTTFPLDAAEEVLHRLRSGTIIGRAVLTPHFV